jgi:DNA/RNA-binding domain of Phe-tRNA-synthetase-like protein
MSEPQPSIDVDAHPHLRPAAFTTMFPQPLGELLTPGWLAAFLSADADPPFRRDDALRMAVRDMLRHWGHKPAGRGKPASEYLVRAVDRGELGLINVAVDACNAVSLHSGFPIALVDLDRTRPPFRVAPGAAGMSYVFNAAGQEIDLKGLVCLFDGDGPCANPVKDAQRTKTHEETTQTLTVIWGITGYEGRLTDALAWYHQILEVVGATVEKVLVRMGETPG